MAFARVRRWTQTHVPVRQSVDGAIVILRLATRITTGSRVRTGSGYESISKSINVSNNSYNSGGGSSRKQPKNANYPGNLQWK